MTVIATMLAGLASSEMTRAQYDRSLAAQLQSKAGDQWGYFQAKKLRSAVAHNTLDLLVATSDVQPLDAAALPDADAATIAALTKNQLPEATPAKFDDRCAGGAGRRGKFQTRNGNRRRAGQSKTGAAGRIAGRRAGGGHGV